MSSVVELTDKDNYFAGMVFIDLKHDLDKGHIDVCVRRCKNLRDVRERYVVVRSTHPSIHSRIRRAPDRPTTSRVRRVPGACRAALCLFPHAAGMALC